MESDPTNRLRLIERWLPFAQQASDHYGWQLDGPALEALIIAATPALEQAPSVLAAQAVLWQLYETKSKEEKPCTPHHPRNVADHQTKPWRRS